jgi:hypothetical protein
MAPHCRLPGAQAGRCQDFRHADPRIAEKPCQADLLGAPIGAPAHAHRAAQRHALQRLAPLFCKRWSPKYPRSRAAISAIDQLLCAEDKRNGITHKPQPARAFHPAR